MNDLLLFVGGIGGWELSLLFVFFFIPAIFWLWALIDLIQANFQDSIIKIFWAIIIIFIPFVGAILYLIVGRKQKAI